MYYCWDRQFYTSYQEKFRCFLFIWHWELIKNKNDKYLSYDSFIYRFECKWLLSTSVKIYMFSSSQRENFLVTQKILIRVDRSWENFYGWEKSSRSVFFMKGKNSKKDPEKTSTLYSHYVQENIKISFCIMGL